MSIGNSPYLTRIQNISLAADIADKLLTPVYVFFGGRQYEAHRTEGEYNFVVKEKPYYQTIHKVAAIVATLLVFPVLIGFALKHFAMKNERYREAVQQIRNENSAETPLEMSIGEMPVAGNIPNSVTSSAPRRPSFSRKGTHISAGGLKLVPKCSEDMKIENLKKLVEELPEYKSEESFLVLMDSVVKQAYPFADEDLRVKNERDTLSANLKQLVQAAFDPDKLSISYRTDDGINALACEQLRIYLFLILQSLQGPEFDDIEKKLTVLKEVAYPAERGACKPTWVETPANVYRELKGENDAEQLLLRYVLRIKEQIILNRTQNREGDGQWHGLNFVRKNCPELGLDQTNLELDRYAGMYHANMSTSDWHGYFMKTYTPIVLTTGLESAINSNEFNPEIAKLLQKCAVADYSEEKGLTIQEVEALPEEEFSEVEFVMKHYYKTDGKTINKAGVTRLLQEIKVLN